MGWCEMSILLHVNLSLPRVGTLSLDAQTSKQELTLYVCLMAPGTTELNHHLHVQLEGEKTRSATP